jgi:signal transduction histidine kinase
MRKLAAKLARGISKTNRHVKQLAKGLVPVAVDADGLMVALSELAERTAEEAGIDCEFFCPTKVRIPDDATALQLYRIAQEAVTNAVKHASPRKIKIGLEYSSGNIEMKVTDDGIGIRQESWSNGGLGLRLMRHRCDLIGGSLDVDRRQPDGTQVCCQIPVDN